MIFRKNNYWILLSIVSCHKGLLTSRGIIVIIADDMFRFIQALLKALILQRVPKPELSEEKKSENQALSRVRILVENAIGGMKRYNILNHLFRNRKENFVDDVIALCAGLWNMILPNKTEMNFI